MKALLFDDPLKFDPERVLVSFCEYSMLNNSPATTSKSLVQPRRYTLTHNDMTRNLTLSVSKEFNEVQTSIWYTKLLRDEVLAEWRSDGLHVFVQVSADGAWWIRWAAPLRAIVFRQKLQLVLDTLRYAERKLFAKHPELLDTPVYVNFSSIESAKTRPEDNEKEYWGLLKDACGKTEQPRLEVNDENSSADTLQNVLERARAEQRSNENRVAPLYETEGFELEVTTIQSKVIETIKVR